MREFIHTSFNNTS